MGDAMSQIAFGAMFVIFFMTMYELLRSPRRNESGRSWILIAYSVVMFCLGLVFISMDLASQLLGFVDNRNFPGGPTAYSISQYSKPITVIPNACFVIAGWLADGFLLYRCLIVFQFRFYIIALPILVYLGDISMGVMTLFQASRPGASLWTKVTTNFGIPYFSLSVTLNVLITLLITGRLLLYRHQVRRTLGAANASTVPYVSIVAMITESSMLYAVFSLLFIGPYASESHVSDIFLPILSQIQIISPMLIIFRVATRRAWDARTLTHATTTLRFQSGVPHRDSTDDHESDLAAQADKEAGDIQVHLHSEKRGKRFGAQGLDTSGATDEGTTVGAW